MSRLACRDRVLNGVPPSHLHKPRRKPTAYRCPACGVDLGDVNPTTLYGHLKANKACRRYYRDENLLTEDEALAETVCIVQDKRRYEVRVMTLDGEGRLLAALHDRDEALAKKFELAADLAQAIARRAAPNPWSSA